MIEDIHSVQGLTQIRNLMEIGSVVFLSLGVILELIGLFVKPERPKRILEFIGIGFFLLLCLTDFSHYKLETKLDANISADQAKTKEEFDKSEREKDRQIRILKESLSSTQAVTEKINEDLKNKKEVEEQADRKKRTPPTFHAFLTVAGQNSVKVHIISQNLIPFQFNHVIVSDGDRLANGLVPVGMATFYPTKSNRSFEEIDEVRLSQIKNGYLELRVIFKSLADDELHLPGHSGRVIAKFLYSNDHTRLISIP